MSNIKRDIIKIYFWQFLSVAFNLGSLLIVTPKVSSIPNIYGIYSICLTSLLFFSYADLGFLSAAYKYASEYFIRDEKGKEIKITGFALFILSGFTLIYTACLLLLAFNPAWIIKGIHDGEINTARYLFIILAVSSPIILSQRFLQLIYGVRMKEYIYHRINLIGNIIKILSVFYFFGTDKYQLVPYFGFLQLVNLFVVIISIIIAGKKFTYSFSALLKNIRYSRTFFNTTRKLAFSTFFLNISWILYYELDSFAIGKLLGAYEAGIYAVGFSILTLFRSFFSIIYSPFNARFNHYKGLGDIEGLKTLVSRLIVIMLPFFVLLIPAFCLFMEPFIISWVGHQYTSSVISARLLVLCNVLGFIAYPCGILLITLEQIKKLYWISITAPVLYWIGISFTVQHWGIESFAIFKLFIFLIMGIYYFFFLRSFLKIPITAFIIKHIKPVIIPMTILFALYYFIKPYIPEVDKGTFYFIRTILTIGGLTIIASVFYYFSSNFLRKTISALIKSS